MTFSQQIKTSKTDEYYTPRYAVRLLLPFLKKKKYRHIWCPFDKESSEFVKILREEGFQVTHGHLETGQDFFGYSTPPEGVEVVVSNPPFSKREAILKQLYDWNLPFGLILNFNGLFDSKTRWNLFKDNKFELLIPKGRMKFFNADLVRNSPSFQSIYVCSGILDEQIVFEDMTVDLN